MNKIIVLPVLVMGLHFSAVVFASQAPEATKMDTSELRYSDIFRCHHTGTANAKPMLLPLMISLIIKNEKFRETHLETILKAIIEEVEGLVTSEQTIDTLTNTFLQSLGDIDNSVLFRQLLRQAAALAAHQAQGDVYKVLMSLADSLKEKAVAANESLEEAIDAKDAKTFAAVLKQAGFSTSEIERTVKLLSSGCHEFAGYFDYDEKGKTA